MENVNIKYFDKEMPKIKKLNGDWLDLRVRSMIVIDNDKDDIEAALENKDSITWTGSKRKSIQPDKVVFMKLGVAMELPEGYEAEIRPRSGTFKNYGLLLTNSVGTIDNIFKGDNDEWCAMFYSTRFEYIEKYDRILQFRINKNQPEINFIEKDTLGNEDRGGYNSTGVK